MSALVLVLTLLGGLAWLLHHVYLETGWATTLLLTLIVMWPSRLR